MRSLSSEQYEVVASFEDDLRTPEEGVTEQLQAAEFGALSLTQKQAEQTTGEESEGSEADPAAPDSAAGAETPSPGNEADPAALDITAAAPVYGAEVLSEGTLPSRADSVEAELAAAAAGAEGQASAGIAESHSSSIVEEAEAVNPEAAAAEEAAAGALEDLEGTETEGDEQAAAAPALQQLAGEQPTDLDIPAEVRTIFMYHIILYKYMNMINILCYVIPSYILRTQCTATAATHSTATIQVFHAESNSYGNEGWTHSLQVQAL